MLETRKSWGQTLIGIAEIFCFGVLWLARQNWPV
jgi:hypothetical protein